jgi:hypothetical protein
VVPLDLVKEAAAVDNSRDSRKGGEAILLPLEADAEVPRCRGMAWHLGLAAAASGLVLVSPLPLWTRPIAVAGVLVVAVLVELLRRLRARPLVPRKLGASLAVDAQGVWRLGNDGQSATLARWDEAFGVTVLANPSQTRGLLAFTSAARTRIVGVTIEKPEVADPSRRCFERAVPVADADLDDALGGTRNGCLTGRSASVLLAEIEKRTASAIGRIYLSDASGAKVTLEGTKLGAREKVIDLTDAVEWRSFMFHEGDLAAVTVYQATWIHQAAIELVLVCPIPADVSSWGIGRITDPPPAPELRVAVDRLFMIPLRRALESAPRISRPNMPRRSSHAIRNP